MTAPQQCPCNSQKEYSECCGKIHQDPKNAASAEQLMRARYSAFVRQEIDFIYNTFHPTTRRFQNKKDIAIWAQENKWMQLEIVQSSTHTVEFKAHFLDMDGQVQIHHEKSTFKQQQNCWYYVDGKIMQ